MLNGVINILKPPGMTSHDIVSVVRRATATKRVGHSGTLDPAAAGVLPVFVGSAARFIEYFPTDKQYLTEIIFGCATDTCDDTGMVIDSCQTLPEIDPVKLQLALQDFTGKISQQPPIYSAIKVDGKKLYEYARDGQDVIIKQRAVSIDSILLLGVEGNIARICVNCSSGTYIRSLCRDVGRAMNLPSMMGFLLRSAVGEFPLTNTVTIEQVVDNVQKHITPVERLLECFLPKVSLSSANALLFQDGIRKTVSESDTEVCIVVGEPDVFCGIASVERGMLIPKKVVRNILAAK
ncbi:MAG: tRNA pseudouridine(55) synthase TruB [Bacillota bacterium]